MKDHSTHDLSDTHCVSRPGGTHDWLAEYSLHHLLLQASATDVTLLDFRSDRCGPCRAMDPIVAELQQAGVNVRVVNNEQEPQLAQRFRVGPIPCFVVMAGDQESVRHVVIAKRSELEKHVTHRSRCCNKHDPHQPRNQNSPHPSS